MAKHSKAYYQHLPNKVGGKIRGHGRVTKIRTIHIGKGKIKHVRVMSKRGPRGGRTIAGGTIRVKRHK